MRKLPAAALAVLALTGPSAGDPPAAPGAAPARSWPADGVPRTHAADVADYSLRASLNPVAHTVHGEGTIRWKNASATPVRQIWLHLYLNAFKNERSAFLRERVGGRGSAAPEDWGSIDVRTLTLREDGGATVDLLPSMETRRAGDDDETDALVPLPREVAPGETIHLDVAFDDKLPIVVERTGYRGAFHMVGQWFPKIARLEADGTWAHFAFHHLAEFYADFGTYDVTLDVPESFTIAATGPVAESRVQDGRRVERHVQADIHDFAWAAWDRWRVAREKVGDVDVAVFFPPGFERIADRELAAIRFALPYESARYGAYPYSVLTVVHPQQDAGEAGGMEYPTLITGAGAWWTPPGILTPEIVTVHELGHQWFYGLVATNEALWPVLDEGLNSFAEADAMSKWRGASSAVDLLGLSVSDAEAQAVVSSSAAHNEPVAQPAYAFSSGASYGRLVYARTAALLETLARVYGDDAVAEALGRYARRFRFEHPGPEDLIAVFAEVLGSGPAATLRAALFDKGWVDYVVDGVWCERIRTPAGASDPGSDGGTLPPQGREDWEGAVVVRRLGTLSFPVDVELSFADGSTRRERWDGEGAVKRIAWRGPVALRGAVVDPDERILVDANVENNHAATGKGGGGAPRSLERAAYWAGLALQVVSP